MNSIYESIHYHSQLYASYYLYTRQGWGGGGAGIRGSLVPEGKSWHPRRNPMTLSLGPPQGVTKSGFFEIDIDFDYPI